MIKLNPEVIANLKAAMNKPKSKQQLDREYEKAIINALTYGTGIIQANNKEQTINHIDITKITKEIKK